MSAPPARDGVCDDHPESRLVQRADDEENTVRRRLAVYRQDTEPVIGFYRSRGRLTEIEGMGSVDGVYAALKRAVCGA